MSKKANLFVIFYRLVEFFLLKIGEVVTIMVMFLYLYTSGIL